MRYPESAAERLFPMREACRVDVSHAAAPASRRDHVPARLPRGLIPFPSRRGLSYRGSSLRSEGCRLSAGERTMTRPPSRRPGSNKAPGHHATTASTQRVGGTCSASTLARGKPHTAATTQYGTAGDRAAGDGAASDRAASDRAASDRAASDRAAGDGAAGDRAAGDRAASDGAASGLPHSRGAVICGRRFGHEQW
jgi:hypothetical protein